MRSFKYICNTSRPFHMMDTRWHEGPVKVFDDFFRVDHGIVIHDGHTKKIEIVY